MLNFKNLHIANAVINEVISNEKNAIMEKLLACIAFAIIHFKISVNYPMTRNLGKDI
jgi:hypothetical protein